MAIINTKGKGKALLVINSATKEPIEIPLAAQESILAPMVNLRTWVKKYIRTGGIGKMVPGGKIKYYAYPKQTTARDIEITYDNTDGSINGGMFGAGTGTGVVPGKLFTGIASTMGTRLVSDEITLETAKFLKHRFSKYDAKQEGLGALVTLKLADFTAEIEEDALATLKANMVAAMGTVGKWATDEGYVVPAGEERLEAKNYTVDAAGGKAAVDKIVADLQKRDKLGLKGSADEKYPFARGLNSANSAAIGISQNINKAILAAVEESQNGFLSGVGVNKETGIVTSISYDGKTVSVEVIDDMPQKGGFDFNFFIMEVGKFGAMAFPNMFSPQSIVRADSEGLESLYNVLEAVGLVAALKFYQPELIWASFGTTVSTK